MKKLDEFEVALGTVLALLRQAGFWKSMARALVSPPLLAGVALSVVLLKVVPTSRLYASVGSVAMSAALGLIGFMLLPILLYALCPAVARAVVQGLQAELPEVRKPSFVRFFGGWLLLAILSYALWALAVFVPFPFGWVFLLPGAILYSGYLLRCTLCVHAGPKERRAIVARTMWPRTLLWLPLTAIPFCVAAELEQMISGGGLDLPVALAMLAIELPLCAAMLALWTVLGLGAMRGTALQVELKNGAPARSSPGKGWTLALATLLLAFVYLGRFTLLDHYMAWTDASYAAEYSDRSQGSSKDRMMQVFSVAACKGQLARIQTLFAAQLNPDRHRLQIALGCAAWTNQREVVEYLLAHGADVNGGTEFAADNPLRRAVEGKHLAMAELLLQHGAEPAHYLLSQAARGRDLDMIRLLNKAGARSDHDDRSLIATFIGAHLGRGEAVDWAAVLAQAEAAGMPIGGLDENGGNLLHLAARHGAIDLIAQLLKRGEDWHQADRMGVRPFLRLAEWYQASKTEPGPELEAALVLLTDGVPDINADAGSHLIAAPAAARRRVRLLFGERVSYAGLGQPGKARWPLEDHDQAAQLLADLSPHQMAEARELPDALRQRGWDDLARQAERQR